MSSDSQGFMRWLGGKVRNVLTASQEARIEGYVDKIDAHFARMRQQFDFSQAVVDLEISPGDRPIVAERVYQRFLSRSWKDGQVSDREQQLLAWVAQTLDLSSQIIAALNGQAALAVFKHVLVQSFADGRIDATEAARLQAVAAHTGQTVGELMDRFFQHEGDAFLRNVFSGLAANGNLTQDEWRSFKQTCAHLGIPAPVVLQAIRQPAHQLVEHVLADARSDGEISEREEKVILALLASVIDDAQFARYVRRQVEEAKEMQRIASGVLPSITAPTAIAMRAGEIVHWAGSLEYIRTRETARGEKVEEMEGQGVITDTRMILTAAEKSLQINHRKVLAHIPYGDELEIRTDGKGAGRYCFPKDGERGVRIWQVAIGRANQTIVASDDSQARRRISREVRQRVWQRFGGRCAECNADTYLEFDHIIPVAKGGGNSETNVQLLCRKCNLAKSDTI